MSVRLLSQARLMALEGGRTAAQAGSCSKLAPDGTGGLELAWAGLDD